MSGVGFYKCMNSAVSTVITIRIMKYWTNHRVIILNRGSMFAFQWREFSPPLSSAHRLFQCYHRQKRDRRRCNSRGIPPQCPAIRVISQWERNLEWRHAVTLHILVGKICISFFLFYCEGMLSLVVLWDLWNKRACSLKVLKIIKYFSPLIAKIVMKDVSGYW